MEISSGLFTAVFPAPTRVQVIYQAFNRYFGNDGWMKERRKEREREKEGREGGGGRQERKSLENSLFKFIKVTDRGNKNSDRIL